VFMDKQRRGVQFSHFQIIFLEERIKRQCSTTYISHQRGVAKHKTKIMMNMVCYMLFSKRVLKGLKL